MRELGLQGATVEVAFEVDNGSLFGYQLDAPAIRLVLDGREVARAGLVRQPLPAFARTPVVLRFQASPLDLGASLLSLLQAGGGVSVGLTGRLEFGIPGLVTQTVALDGLVQGSF